MCVSKPSIPAPAPPPQEVKQPDSVGTGARQKNRQTGGGTMLTGSGGVASGSLNTGGTTLLGG